MKFSDLEMSYEASAFDALKNVQYYEGAEQKYFINLTGTNNNPGIPEEFKGGEPNQNYRDGINRMNEKEIFYISNTDDGQIVTDSNSAANHQGLGSTNGFYASGDDYVGLIAQYIAQNHFDGVRFQPQSVESKLPLANFYIKDARTDSEQMMTIHIQHLVNSNETVPVNIVDKSLEGFDSDKNGKLESYHLTITDPNNKVAYDKTVTDPMDLEDFVFTKDSVVGRYTFTLIVTDKDAEGKVVESKDFSTYITAFKDTKMPKIECSNTARNTATLTFTDTGEGIDEDGITFLEDERGSGVAAYWITNDVNAEPTEENWELLAFAQHSIDVDIDIDSTNPVVVWVRDECGNRGAKAVFQPTHVLVKDPEDNPIEDYYVIDDKPIIVLPDPIEKEDVDPDDPSKEHFSGWVTGDNDDPITPDDDPVADDNHEIIIRPSYSQDRANITFLGNGGTVNGDKTSFDVISGTSILTKLNSMDMTATRTGYTFDGWKLLKSGDPDHAANSDYINTATNVETVGTQIATVEKNGQDAEGEDIITRDNYYLVAQWKIGEYTLRLNPNGGSAGNVKSIEGVKFGTDVNSLNIPVSGRGIPSRAGYFFRGWSVDKGNDVNNIFKLATGYSHATVQAPTMPAGDMTIYAVWEQDKTKYTVDYYYNSGEVDKNGKFIYTKLTGKMPGTDETYTKTRVAPTESTVSVRADDIYSELTVDGVKYWYNPDAVKTYDADGNLISNTTGTVTGSPALSLKLYYDRYFTINTSDNGNGTVEMVKKDDGTIELDGKLAVKEGSVGTVTWAPKEGYYVSRVIVDGAVRDDLVNAKEYTFPTGFHENHRIYVAFTSNDIPKDPINPGPIAPEERYYSVSTSVVGCSDESKYSITPSTSAKAGSDVRIQWNVTDSQYFVSKVEVDGVEQNVSYKSFDFNSISADHNVKITLSTLPTIGGSTVENDYTVTVNRYGGDEKVTVSDSKVVKEHEDVKVEWNVNDSDYRVIKVMVDGKAINLRDDKSGSRNLNNITANHVVDVYFAKPDQQVPDFNNDQEFIQVTTQLVGAPGTITGGAVVEKGMDYDVNWDVTTKADDSTKGTDKYFYYEIEKVEVNGVEQDQSDASNVALTDINEDTDVKVYVKPVLHRVTILKYGEGTVSASKTVYHMDDYNGIGCTPRSRLVPRPYRC